MERDLILWFDETGEEAFGLVGGKGINLARMTRAGLPVPPGFVVTTAAFARLFDANPLVAQQVREHLEGLDVNDIQQLEQVGGEIRRLIGTMTLPVEVSLAIREAYNNLGGLVAVRSSATAEDLPDASFAGQQVTLLNVQGVQQVLEAVRECIASLFTDRAIAYRAEQGIDQLTVEMAVVVQTMVQSYVSGVMMTVDPQTGKKKVVIDAVRGLGEYAVSGIVSPDAYEFDLDSNEVFIHVSHQEVMLVRNPNGEGNVELPVPEEMRNEPKLTRDQIFELVQIGLRVEAYYGNQPQDIEWAMDEAGNFYLVQSRPITTTDNVLVADEPAPVETALLLATGQGASSGVGYGRVVVLQGPHENNLIKKGDILVTRMTTPDFVPAMKKASAIVTEQGGRTCHASIVSRELGVPCVVGVEDALTLEPGSTVTVDGYNGKVYAGEARDTVAWHERQVARREAERKRMADVKTRTKLGVILAEPESAAAVAAQNVDIVGLLRAELVLARIGRHPRDFIAAGEQEVFIRQLAEAITAFCQPFGDRQVVYRTTDYKTNEYAGLKGAEEYEGMVRRYDAAGHLHLISQEENPMMGLRGARRYLVDRESFGLECEAIRRVAEQYGNLHVMIPFVRTPAEIRQVRALMAEFGVDFSRISFGMMVEVPSNVILLADFIREGGLQFLSLGSNDLTQLTLGADRDNPGISAAYDERDPAVMALIEQTIRVAHEYGVRVGICGNAPSNYPWITGKLVEWGIDSISVMPDTIGSARAVILEAERRLDEEKS